MHYLNGFGNELESEAVAGALPRGQFSPQRHPLGLYTEKLSITAFTSPREHNRRLWLYRIRPSVTMGEFRPWQETRWQSAPLTGPPVAPDALRWDAPAPDGDTPDFVESLITVAANGDAAMQIGMAALVYGAERPMTGRSMVNCDGEMLIVPWHGTLEIRTECGLIRLDAGEIAVIPRGMKFACGPAPDAGPARGYVAENYGAPLRLPERGPVGSDGFANTRDFQTPVAAYADKDDPHEVICKFQGGLFAATIDHDPFDVVAWTGNAAPYKYNLARFNAMGSVSFDHPDPSIYTVLTSPSAEAGVANLDFVVFPPRWLVAEGTFRPPWFHRNVMSEFMGLISGAYDGKADGFVPGGMSLHNCMVPHGPDAAVYAAASAAELVPTRLTDTLAFMFESRYVLKPSAWALAAPSRQADYRACWDGLRNQFRAP